jgi:hypothetical protein
MDRLQEEKSRKGRPPANRDFLKFSALGLVVVILLGVSISPNYFEAAGSQSHTGQGIADYQDSGTDMIQLLSRASDKLKIPVGIELDKELPSQIVSVRVSKGTVADVFSALVNRLPDYRWVEQDGVIDILPLHSSNGVLDLHIRRFQVKNATPINVREAVDALPEVQAWFKQNGIVDRSPMNLDVLAPTRGKPAISHVSLSLSNVTLREILNSIVRKPPLSGWVVSRYGQGAQYLNIQIN